MGRASQALTILPSLSRAVVTKSRTVKNPRARGGIFNFDYSSPTSAPTVGPTFAVEGLAAGTTADQWYEYTATGGIVTVSTCDSSTAFDGPVPVRAVPARASAPAPPVKGSG